MTHRRLQLGAAGEERAATWYAARGFEVLDRNWRCKEGELDLVCTDGRLLVFCEVKTRSSLAYGHPALAVTEAKQRKLRVLAGRWLAANPTARRLGVRFDVAAVLPERIDVFEQAF